MRPAAALVLGLLSACGGGSGNVATATPSQLDWGEIDFQQDMPDEGYDAVDFTVSNDGKADLDIVLRGFDTTRLRLGAPLLVRADPPTLPTLSPGQSMVMRLGVYAYADGDRDTLVSGSFELEAAGIKDPTSVPWSFTPIRIIDTDTFQ
jgi:hypothetical protein